MFADIYHRELRDLRISVTDRCNFRCTYCMPFDEYVWIDREELLSFEEITRLTRLFVQLGVRKVRLTGGEPLLRSQLESLITQLCEVPELSDICLTTNASRLVEKAAPLRAAGLSRINISLDTLDADKFKRMTKREELPKVLNGIFAAKASGFEPIKINMVVERGINDEEIISMVEFCREHEFSLRFIEYMDVGNANAWSLSKIVSKKEILERIHAVYPTEDGDREKISDPAIQFAFSDRRGDIGFIASVTEPFCTNCTRARLTADGKLVTCLFSNDGLDLKTLLRGGATDDALTEVITSVWSKRSDRYSDERLEAMNSSEGYNPRRQKKIEMITLGG
ncbi:MAG TPA: GTP 3',8-cyclase MoaA [Nitrospirales bacterium]|nr:GTP 3',8-cyclase MoaA [Nitrospirales bacterium]